MSTLKITTAILIAGSVFSTPAIAQERKTLFQVLFPKAHERKVQRERARLEALKPQLPRELPRVKQTRNYVYKVAAFTPIAIKAKEIEFAAVLPSDGVEIDEENQSLVSAPEASVMTKDLEANKELVLRAEKHLAAAIADFYSENQEYHWVTETGEWNAKARSVMKVLEDADTYGLRAADYAVNQVSPVSDSEADLSSARLTNEIAFSIAVARYAMDAEFGTINPNRLSGYHAFPAHDSKASAILEKVFTSGALPAITLKSFHPQHVKFTALKSELQNLMGAEDEKIDLPAKVLIKPGMQHPELPNFVNAIKKRGSEELLADHAELFAAYTNGDKYTPSIVALVKDYQKEAGLGADGIIGKNTSAKLAGIGSADKIDRVKLAMERLRWLPNEFGERHVFINQPEFRARYIEGGNEALSMRVVVGKKSNQTNFFYDEIDHVVYNPYWGVPKSIVVNKFLPKSIANPGYLDQSGYEVTTFGGKRLSSSSINWTEVGANPNFAVRQPPGPKNALGELKIMFPNKHAIYMHDTPAKNLFKKDYRAYSHGCVRLHDPHAMAAAVLGKSKGQVKAAISTGRNQTEKLREKVPVYVSYFTAWPQKDGSVKYFGDIYDRDKHLLKAMDATEKVRAANTAS